MSTHQFQRCVLKGCCFLFLVLAPIPASSETLPLGSSVHGSLTPTGTAEYSITIPAPGTLTITLDNWLSTYNWGMDIDRMYLYNAVGDPVGWEQFGSEDDPYLFHMMEGSETFPITIGVAGMYTLKLHSGDVYQWPENVNTQSYTIAATFSEANDLYEDNGSLQAAAEIALDTVVTAYQWRPTATTAVYDDEDYYCITVPGPGILTIKLDGWISTYNWSANYDRMYLYTSDGVSFNSAGEEDIYSWMMGDDFETAVNLAAGGTYYLCLHAGNGTSMEPYSLQFGFQPITDTQEPNDQADTAAPVASGEQITAYQWRSLEQSPVIRGDEDWYSFTVAQDDTVTVSIDGWASTYNWGTDYDSLYLYRLGGPEPEQIDRKDMLGNSPSYEFILTAGDYALRLHSGNGVSTEPYTLVINFPEESTAVENESPLAFALEPPYPNPFNPQTTISYTLPEAARVRLAVYSVTGQQVATLVDERQAAGTHAVVFDAGGLASGVYFYRCETPGAVRTGKMVLVR